LNVNRKLPVNNAQYSNKVINEVDLEWCFTKSSADEARRGKELSAFVDNYRVWFDCTGV